MGRITTQNIISSFLALALLVGCASTEHRTEDLTVGASTERIGDLTVGQSSVCEVHRVDMTPKQVVETFGMRPSTPIDVARPHSFPHADEPYDTRACMKSYDYSRVYVCSECTRARTDWLKTNIFANQNGCHEVEYLLGRYARHEKAIAVDLPQLRNARPRDHHVRCDANSLAQKSSADFI